MKMYTITQWRQKLRRLLFFLILLLGISIGLCLYYGSQSTPTLTNEPGDELQQDVLTQPIRVQALPDTESGVIPS